MDNKKKFTELSREELQFYAAIWQQDRSEPLETGRTIKVLLSEEELSALHNLYLIDGLDHYDKSGIRQKLTRMWWFLEGSQLAKLPVVKSSAPNPPRNVEYLLYLFLRNEDRDVVIGDLIETYGKVLKRFDKRRADFWFYKQVIGSLWPLLKRAAVKIGALVWLGHILRRLIS